MSESNEHEVIQYFSSLSFERKQTLLEEFSREFKDVSVRDSKKSSEAPPGEMTFA